MISMSRRRLGVRHAGPLVAVVVAAVMLAAGASSASATGNTLAWGVNTSGQFGNGLSTGSNRPVTAAELPGTIKQIAAAGAYTLALLTNGKVYAWGSNGWGQLGNGTTTSSSTPVLVSSLSEVTAIAAGGSVSMALLSNGKVKAWGNNNNGQLGNGTTTKSTTPVEVEGLPEEAVAIAVGTGGRLGGGGHGLAVMKGGTVEAWGNNRYGQLGTGSLSGPEKCIYNEPGPPEQEFREWNCSRKPVEVSGLSGVTAVAAGAEYSLALLSGGGVEAWGVNAGGQLGQGTHVGPETCTWFNEEELEAEIEEEPCSTAPLSVSGLSEVSKVAAGTGFAIALGPEGTAKAWGANGSGQIGDGSTSERDAPVAVSGLTGATAISAGGTFSLALLAGGTAESWGSNGSGELGNGTNEKSTVPVSVANLTGSEGIAAGGSTAFSFGTAGPTITGKPSPTSGVLGGGTKVELKGTNLTGVTQVMFEGNAATSVEELSGTAIRVTTPAGAKPGNVSVTVRTSHGVAPTSLKFTYSPEGSIVFGRCAKVTAGTGEWLNNACTEAGKGSFEWHSGVVLNHFSASGGAATFENTALTKLSCTAQSASGEYEGEKLVNNVTIVLTGCTLGTSKCTTAGAKSGELVTVPLVGGLGWDNKAKNKVGLVLSPAGESETWIEASCGESSVVIKGSVIAAITAVNKMTGSFKVKWAQSKGSQKPEQLEGEPIETLQMNIGGAGFKKTGLALESTLSNEESIEINTVV